MINTEDTELVRHNFRLLIQRSTVLVGVGNFVYSIVFYFMGVDVWNLLFLSNLLCIPILFLTTLSRSLPTFLAGVFTLVLLALFWPSYLTVAFGRELGFHFPLIPVLLLIVVSGRINIIIKSVFILGLASIIIRLDTITYSEALVKNQFDAGLVTLLHFINGVVAVFALTGLMFHYFKLMTLEHHNLKALAITDSLTKLFNRMYMQEVAEQSMEQCRRHADPYSVLLCDLDFFKSVNDRLGHEAGDEVLRQTSNLLKEFARKSDCVGRWGGEEFLFLLPQTGIDGAKRLANRIRAGMEAQRVIFKGEEIKITISIGIGIVGDEDTLDTVVARADKALYLAKEKGRNKVRIELNGL